MATPCGVLPRLRSTSADVEAAKFCCIFRASLAGFRFRLREWILDRGFVFSGFVPQAAREILAVMLRVELRGASLGDAQLGSC